MKLNILILLVYATTCMSDESVNPKAMEVVQYLRDSQNPYLNSYIDESPYPYFRTIPDSSYDNDFNIPAQDGNVNVLNIADGTGTKIVYIKNFPTSKNPEEIRDNNKKDYHSVSGFISNVNGMQSGAVSGNNNGVPFFVPFGAYVPFMFGSAGTNAQKVPNRFNEENGGNTQGNGQDWNHQFAYPGYFPGQGLPNYGFLPPYTGYPSYGGYPPYGGGVGFTGQGGYGPGGFGAFGSGFGGQGGYGPSGFGSGFGGPVGFGPGFGGPGPFGVPGYGFGGYPAFEGKPPQDDKKKGPNPHHELYEDRTGEESAELKPQETNKEPQRPPPKKTPVTISTKKPDIPPTSTANDSGRRS